MNKNYNKFFFFLLFFMFAYACQNDNSVESTSFEYLGSWKWAMTGGGFGGTTSDTPEIDEVVIINFNSAGTFTLCKNDTLKVSADYEITGQVDDQYEITYSNVQTFGYNYNDYIVYASMSSDRLIIWDGEMDGYFKFYDKVD